MNESLKVYLCERKYAAKAVRSIKAAKVAEQRVDTAERGQALNSAIHASSMAGHDRSLTFATIAAAYDKLHRFDDAAGAWRATTTARDGDLWLNWARLARSLASGGRKEDALRAADVAYSRTNGQKSLQEMVKRFRESIVNNCYPAGHIDLARRRQQQRGNRKISAKRDKNFRGRQLIRPGRFFLSDELANCWTTCADLL